VVGVNGKLRGEKYSGRETNIVLNVDAGVHNVDSGSLASAAVIDILGGGTSLVRDAAEAPCGTRAGLEVGLDLSVLLNKCNLMRVSYVRHVSFYCWVP
jgi:hypothetical protein